LEFNIPFQHKYGYIRDDPQGRLKGDNNVAFQFTVKSSCFVVTFVTSSLGDVYCVTTSSCDEFTGSPAPYPKI